jgi:Cu(I)/Ag(I) efflux system membrane fusion protein
MKRLYPLGTLLIGLIIGFLVFGRTAESAHDHDPSDPELVWTCSMHPSIRQNEPGSCPLCGMDLVPASASSDSDPSVLTMTDAAVRLADIRTVPAERSAVERMIPLPGRIAIPESGLTRVVALVSGRVDAEHVGYEGRTVKAGEVLVRIWSPEILTAWQELRTDGLHADAVAERLRYWGVDEAQIRRIRESGEPVRLVDLPSPATGVVVRRAVRPGDLIEPGMALYEIADLSRVWVEFDAIEQDHRGIRTGAAVRFSTPTLPGRAFRAQVVFIDPIVDAASRTVRVRAETANPDGLLKPDMRVSGEISAPRTTATLIPTSAVLWTGPRSLVYVRLPGEEPRFERREVTLGDRAGDRISVLNGLVPGERVVANGAFTVDAEFQLSGKPGMLDQVGPLHSHREVTDASHVTLLIPGYLSVKEALVRSDAVAAASAADGLLARLRSEPLRDAAWNRLREALMGHVAGWNRVDIEVQRTRFKLVTDLMADAIPQGSIRSELYVQFCPMAFGNTGARWLSDKPLIENPYLPQTMLGCGEVVGKL